MARGLPRNFEEALRWVMKAAEQGYAIAQFDLDAFHTNLKVGIDQDLLRVSN